MENVEATRKRGIGCGAAWLTMILLLLLAIFVGLGAGRYSAAPGELLVAAWNRLTGTGTVDAQLDTVLFKIRLPRLLLALLAGAGLSAAGTAFQSLFANPLATPDTMGVASGASFGAVLGLLWGMPMAAVQVMAFAGGLLAVMLTSLSGGMASARQAGGRRSTGATILAGVMISSLFSALISLVKYVADAESQLPSITYWLMGSLASVSYESLRIGMWPILLGLTILLAIRWRMNVLPLGDDEARSTGVNLPLLRGLTIAASTMLTAAVVSMCGQVGWVGLLVPHMCRMLFGGNTKRIVPASMLLGAAFLALTDTLARTLTAAEIPLSVLTAILGAPAFIMLLRKTGGWSL